MRRLWMLCLIAGILCMTTACSYTEEEYKEAVRQAYEDGYYDAIKEAPINEIDDIRHDDLIEYIVENEWKSVLDALDPVAISEYLDSAEPVDFNEVNFIANTASSIYHKKDCARAADIAKENILYWCDSEESLTQAGYHPCSVCLPSNGGTPIIQEYDFDAVSWVETPDSTAFVRIGYNESEEDLVVEFRSSGLYVYHAVPESVWNSLNDADSRGGFYNQDIKGKYDCEKIATDGGMP